MRLSSPTAVDLLILGAGWTSTFLLPLCIEEDVTTAATTRTGRDGTLAFALDPNSDDEEPYKALPAAKTVLISFPTTTKGGSERLVRLYRRTHEGVNAAFVQLGATSSLGTDKDRHAWYDRHSTFAETERVLEENALLALSSSEALTVVLNLSGLWGGQRHPRNWVGKVAATKDALRAKGSIHLIHGQDVARAILAVHSNISKAAGQRWVLTYMRVYDWWDLASAFAPEGPQAKWTMELMVEAGVRALPRDMTSLGRALDSRDFWTTFGLVPVKAPLV